MSKTHQYFHKITALSKTAWFGPVLVCFVFLRQAVKGVCKGTLKMKRPHNLGLASINTGATARVEKRNYFMPAVIFLLGDSPETRAQEHRPDETNSRRGHFSVLRAERSGGMSLRVFSPP